MSYYGQRNAIKAFYEIENYDFSKQQFEKIKNEIESHGKNYILQVDEEQYKNFLIDKYSIEPITIDFASESVGEPSISKEWREGGFDRGRLQRYQLEVYTFTIYYQFTGSAMLFRIKPSPYQMTTTEIHVDDQAKMVSFNFKLYKKDPAEFNRAKNECHKSAFANLDNANIFARGWNNGLAGTVGSYFQAQKKKWQQENDFFAAINVKVNKDTASVFTAPTIKKKIVPQPTVSKTKEFSTEPMMATEMYDDILKVIYELGKNMEKKPSTYQKKDEEGLRDQILLVLETRYEATTATGETFNRGGKTDIILKYSKDNSNLFVGECKFWHGANEFHKAISQLFDRYLTWRDSKTALILFVKNKDFTNVLETIKSEIKLHPYYTKDNGKRGETSFSYIFHLPQDPNKNVFVEVIAFHYDK